MACVSVAVAIVLISVYEFSTLSAGEDSIIRENLNSYYYYSSIRESFLLSNDTIFETDLKNFALMHGYSVDFVCKGGNRMIMFVDKDINIQEELIGGLGCP